MTTSNKVVSCDVLDVSLSSVTITLDNMHLQALGSQLHSSSLPGLVTGLCLACGGVGGCVCVLSTLKKGGACHFKRDCQREDQQKKNSKTTRVTISEKKTFTNIPKSNYEKMKKNPTYYWLKCCSYHWVTFATKKQCLQPSNQNMSFDVLSSLSMKHWQSCLFWDILGEDLQLKA